MPNIAANTHQRSHADVERICSGWLAARYFSRWRVTSSGEADSSAAPPLASAKRFISAGFASSCNSSRMSGRTSNTVWAAGSAAGAADDAGRVAPRLQARRSRRETLPVHRRWRRPQSFPRCGSLSLVSSTTGAVLPSAVSRDQQHAGGRLARGEFGLVGSQQPRLRREQAGVGREPASKAAPQRGIHLAMLLLARRQKRPAPHAGPFHDDDSPSAIRQRGHDRRVGIAVAELTGCPDHRLRLSGRRLRDRRQRRHPGQRISVCLNCRAISNCCPADRRANAWLSPSAVSLR